MRTLSHPEQALWQRAMDLVTLVYQRTETFPRQEKYGPGKQLRRAVVAIPSRIADGQGRRTRGEYLDQLSMVSGLLMRVQTQLGIAVRLGYLSVEQAKEPQVLTGTVAKLLNGVADTLERR